MKKIMIIFSMMLFAISCGSGNNSSTDTSSIPEDVQAIVADYNLEELSDADKKYKINLGYL